MVRFRDRGKVKAPDCRVLYALLYGTPRFSWRKIVMMNTWDTRESCTRKMIPYVRLISVMILQQNALPPESQWVSKPIDQLNFALMRRHWKITLKDFGHMHTVEDEQKNSYNFSAPRAAEEGGHDEEMVDEDDETGPAGPWGPKQRYMRPTREISADLGNFVNWRRVPSYRDFNHGQQAVFDIVSAGIGEGREYEVRRKNWLETHQAQLQAQWDLEEAHRERMEKYMEDQQLFQALQRSQMEHLVQQQQEEVTRRREWEENEERLRNEQNTLEGRQWSALYVSTELAINNAKVLHDQERHRRDYEAGLPYAEHAGWTNYSNLLVSRGPSDPSPHWPEALGPLDNYREMFEALTGYSYHPNPPVDPNERYQW
ncbi:hypothetical protein Hanom_Chr08g00736241 [Helianthus anomalus]